jgi:signal peptidase I
VNTPASAPSLKPGRLFFASRLRQPKRFRLICYRVLVPGTGPTLRTHRLCGLPGDVLEIRAGTLFVNGLDADQSLNLTHIFKIQRKDSEPVRFDPRQAYTIPPYTDTLYAPLEDRYVQNNALPAERYILPPGLRDDAIFRVYKKNWNPDNFGPVKIPAGRFFVLGDNRGNTTDSRYLGFIEQSKFIGGVLWK